MDLKFYDQEENFVQKNSLHERLKRLPRNRQWQMRGREE